MVDVGRKVGQYRIEAQIGQGGMATVYRARHLSLDSAHAVKVLFASSTDVRRRLLREGRVQANLHHPNIVSVTDVLEIGGSPALVMEFVEGPSLDEWMKENTPTTDEALWLFRGILRGVREAHTRGVIHRDLKPANILLQPTADGLVPKVCDFGLVESSTGKRKRDAVTLGTPAYMAPEQIRDASQVDEKADVFALGCILFELVAGERAFQAATQLELFERVVAGRHEPIPDDLEPRTRGVIEDALATDPAMRLASTDDMFHRLYDKMALPAALRTPAGLRQLHLSGPDSELTVEPAGYRMDEAETQLPLSRRLTPDTKGDRPPGQRAANLSGKLGVFFLVFAGVMMAAGVLMGIIIAVLTLT